MIGSRCPRHGLEERHEQTVVTYTLADLTPEKAVLKVSTKGKDEAKTITIPAQCPADDPGCPKAAGDEEIKIGKTTYKVHLDGYNLVPYLTGQVDKSPRNNFIYISDDQEVTAVRYENWKLVFLEQRAPGTLRIWAEPFTHLRLPLMFNLRTDPYERANITSNTYYQWSFERAYLVTPAQAFVRQFLESFKEFPIRQKPASFNLDQVVELYMPHP